MAAGRATSAAAGKRAAGRPMRTTAAQASLPGAGARVWTIGYEGRSPDDLVHALRVAGIRRLVDVRELPASRRAGFGKTALQARVQADGIAYTGMRELGAPRDVRHAFRAAGSWDSFAPAYLAHLDSVPEAVEAVAALARTEPIALLCYERDAADCHRGLLAERLAGLGLTPVHL